MLVGAQKEILPLFASQLREINPWMGRAVTCADDQGQVAGAPAARPLPHGELEGFVMLQQRTGTCALKYKLFGNKHLQAVLFEVAEGQAPVVQHPLLLFVPLCDTGWQFGIGNIRGKSACVQEVIAVPRAQRGLPTLPCTPATGTGQGCWPKRNGVT